MKYLFYADLSYASSGSQRLWALRQCGVDPILLRKELYPPSFGRINGTLAKIFRSPRMMKDSRRLNRDLSELCRKEKPDVVWIEWGRELTPETLLSIKNLANRPLIVSFQDDNPWGDRNGDQWMWQRYFDCVPLFDIHIVKRESDLINLKRLGANSAVMWNHGIYPPLFYPIRPKVIRYKASFIGTCMDERGRLIELLLESGVDIHVFGTRWKERTNLPRRFPSNFHPAVKGEAYADVIRESLVCLGLVSHSNRDEWTMRSFEVPGCASAILAERTSIHQQWYTEGLDAELFSTAEECLRKILAMIEDPQRCIRMGDNALLHFQNSDRMIHKNMANLLHMLEEIKLGIEMI